MSEFAGLLSGSQEFPVEFPGSFLGFSDFQVFPGRRIIEVYRPPRGTQAFLRIPRFLPGALKSESSREILKSLGRRRGKRN